MPESEFGSHRIEHQTKREHANVQNAHMGFFSTLDGYRLSRFHEITSFFAYFASGSGVLMIIKIPRWSPGLV